MIERRKRNNNWFLIVCLSVVHCVVLAQNHTDELGRKQGKWVTKLGSKSTVVAYYKDNLLHGKRVVYDLKGIPISEARFAYGKKHGLAVNYFPDPSRPNHIFSYRNGLLHGTCIRFRKGRRHFDVDFSDGKIHGELVHYYKNGQKEFLSYYQKGLIAGKMFFYDKKGRVEEIYYPNPDGTMYILRERYNPKTGKKYKSEAIKQLPSGWIVFGIEVFHKNVQEKIKNSELWKTTRLD